MFDSVYINIHNHNKNQKKIPLHLTKLIDRLSRKTTKSKSIKHSCNLFFVWNVNPISNRSTVIRLMRCSKRIAVVSNIPGRGINAKKSWHAYCIPKNIFHYEIVNVIWCIPELPPLHLSCFINCMWSESITRAPFHFPIRRLIVKSRSPEICIYNCMICLVFDRHLGRTAAEVPVKCQSDTMI